MSSSPPLVVADRYRLVAPLGQGGMGRVWRATDVVLHRDVAIKELVPPPGLTPGERQEMRERSLREARAIARLNNVNVVRVFDVLRTDADPWIVMEYVASRSLHDTLAADGPFNPVRAAEIGLGVLNALRAAHRAGVVHRDVKPGNVLIGADGRVVLTDFGLATVPGDPNVTRTGLVLGSPAYIAPERARDGTAGPAADLWSLGATLYAAVEGASPFARPSAIATLAALATENPPQSRNAGPLKPVLNGLLRKDPTHRINAEEAERLLLRATGRRSKLSFPMSPTMRRPGLGRALPPTGAMPVVPGPRPPVAPSRPSNPPGQAPASGARAAAGDGRPPVFVPGKASVGRPPDKPTRVDPPKVDASRLDPTRVDGPPVRDGQPPFGTRQAPPPPATPPSRPARSRAGEVDPSLARTVRGGPGGFTAADVAAARRKKAAPEHEKSLADAAAAMGQPVDATTVVPPSGKTRPGRKPAAAEQPALADATTVVPPPADRHRLDATTVLPPSADGPRPASADATTVVPAPARPGRKPAVTAPSGDATTVVPSAGRPAPVDMTTVVSPAVGPATTAPPADPTTVVRHPAEPTTVVKHPIDVPSADATTVVPPPSRTGGKPKATVEAPTEPEKALSSEAGADKPEAAKTGDARGDKVVETAGSTTSRTAAGATASSVSGNAATTASRDAASSASGNAASSASKNAGESASAAIARSAEEVAGTTSEEVAATGAERGAGSSAAGLAASSATESTAGDAARAGVGGTAEVEAEKAIEESEAKSTKGNRLGSAKSKTPPAVEAAEPLLALEAAPADAEAVPADAAPADAEAVPADAAPADAAATPADAEAAPIDAAESGLPGASALITEEDGAPSSEAVTPEAQPESAELEPAAKAESGGAAGKETRLAAANAKAGAANAEAGAPNAKAGAANAKAGTANAKAGAANAKAGTANAKAGAANATAGSEDLADPIEDIDDEPAESAVQVALPLARKRRPARTDGGLVGGDPADGMPSDMAPFSPAARPAWKPMQVSPTFRPSAGITIFGTRLTYRQAGIGAAALLVILVLLIVLAVKAFGGGDGKPSAGPTAAKTAATGGPVRNGAGPAPTTGATTAPSSRSSVAPSSEAPARGAAMKLPAGWKWYNRSTQGDWPGFAIPIPQNAAIEPEGSQIYIRWNNRLLIVDRTNAPRPDPVQDWKDQEGNRSYRNYQKIKIVAVNYGGFKASADWEFTYTTDNGNAQHADKRNILVSGSAAYSLNWYTTPADWAASQSDLQAIYQGFQPKP